jgi:uncharacterized protein YndB with AHSA1/START domain
MSSPERELRADLVVSAPADEVWSHLTDLRRLPQWSPELVAMVPLKPGGLRQGQWYLGINRRKGIVWPTRNIVAVLEPRHTLAWDTTSSGARWIWELEPVGPHALATRVTLRRPVPRRLTKSSKLFASTFLGGTHGHADELQDGMQQTLERLAGSLRPVISQPTT